MIVKINNKLKININYNIYNLLFLSNKLRLSKTSNKKVDTEKKHIKGDAETCKYLFT